MTLNKELSILCGGTLGEFNGNPLDIPCIETSDPEKLCAHPVVSVPMITYNHEPYIRQAIDSVMMQKTDFEFELVIGEDCSQDKTRDICFEYQKKYPDKIRVLWWHENVTKYGGNGRRTRAHCRGEYLALLEGDDYWTDPFKLQKQIDIIRSTGSVACVSNYAILEKDGQLREVRYHGNGFITHDDLAHFYPHTATYVMRRDFLVKRQELFPGIHGWYDILLMHCLVETGKVVHLQDVVSVYRVTGTGIATSLSGQKKQLFGIRQYLDLYLNGPRSWHKRFGALVLTYIAFFFNRSTPGWTTELTEQYARDLQHVFWTIYWRQPFDLRTVRALMRYLRFRFGI